MLIKKHGSIAELNTVLLLARTDPKLSLIRNANKRGTRSKPHQMGDAMAREIEERLCLDRGWMDTPPTYAELHGEHDPLVKAWAVFQSLPPDLQPVALRLIDALTQPKAINGNGNTH